MCGVTSLIESIIILDGWYKSTAQHRFFHGYAPWCNSHVDSIYLTSVFQGSAQSYAQTISCNLRSTASTATVDSSPTTQV